jgi:hypothetical protein
MPMLCGVSTFLNHATNAPLNVGVYTCYQHFKYKQKHAREDAAQTSYLSWSVRLCCPGLLKSIVDVDSSCGSGVLGADGRTISPPRTLPPSGAAGENRMRGVRVEFGVAERLTTSLESVTP